ncbi:hypothetical protein CVT24_003846 [Panaeolus cyanescens]|uniref:Uncharacterized protein n=1 Tax=Panaeolus cyanescens TaxID=181874 RepID=A0A409WND8_9AGAR|nr:hypothetical protein CVT24_003846 [Panaeolus cyanescens]
MRTIKLQDAWIICPAQARVFISEITEHLPSTFNLPSTHLPPKNLCKSITFHLERDKQHKPPSGKATKLYFAIIHFIVHHSLLPNLKAIVFFHLGHTLFDAINHILVTDLRIPRDATFIVDMFWVYTTEQEKATRSLITKKGLNFTPPNWHNIVTHQPRLDARLQNALASKSEQRLRDELMFYLTSTKRIHMVRNSTSEYSNETRAKRWGRYYEGVVTTETSDVPRDLQPLTSYEDLLWIFDVFGTLSEDVEVEGVYGELRKEETINWDEYEETDNSDLDDIYF